MLAYLIRPAVFGTQLAAAAFAALAAPVADALARGGQGSPLVAAFHDQATMQLSTLRSALCSDGFPSAVDAERPDAIAALAYAIAFGLPGSGRNAQCHQQSETVVHAFAPGALQVTMMQLLFSNSCLPCPMIASPRPQQAACARWACTAWVLDQIRCTMQGILLQWSNKL